MSDTSTARVILADAVAFLRAEETAQGAAGTTLQGAIAEAILRIDSDVEDPVESLGETESSVEYSAAMTGVDKGKLQRLRDLRTALLGENGSGGAINELIENS